jgi:hypothetical protein
MKWDKKFKKIVTRNNIVTGNMRSLRGLRQRLSDAVADVRTKVT